jgi:hypothetical protein
MRRFNILPILALIAVFSATLNAQTGASLTGRVGTVEILRNGMWVSGMAGDSIASGEHVRTGNLSSAALQLGVGQVITLAEYTEVEVREANGTPGVKLQSGHMKVVSAGDIQVAASNTTLNAAEKPLDMELGYKGDKLNITVITGAVGDGSLVISGTQDAASRTYTAGGAGPRLQDGLTYPTTYYVYPYVNYGLPGTVPNAGVNPQYPGYMPGQIIPPMTDPLRPPVHYPIAPFPDRTPR